MTSLVDAKELYSFIEDLGSDRETFEELYEIFCKHLVEFSAIKLDSDDFNNESLSRLAHKYKSSCSPFGAKMLHSRLQKLEEISLVGDESEYRTLYAEILDIWESSSSEIRQLAKIFFRSRSRSA